MKRFYTVYHDGGMEVVERDVEERRAQERTSYQEQRTEVAETIRKEIRLTQLHMPAGIGGNEDLAKRLTIWRDALQVVTGTRE